MNVPYVPFAHFDARFGDDVRAAIARVLASGVLIGGPEVAAFEEAFALYCGAAHAVAVGSGSDAIELTLRAWNVGPGDEVIVPASTAVPTALAVSRAGARPVVVDVESDTGLIAIEAVEAAITPATRAIVPVHLYGHPVDVAGLRALAARTGLRVLEDCAHAHGARYDGVPVGGSFDAAAFSFYPTKPLGAYGDGGCVTTGDAALAMRLRMLRNVGLNDAGVHAVRGTTSRLDPLQAAVLRWKLERLDGWNDRRRALAALYLDALAGTPGLTLPVVRARATPVWHVFPVLVHDGLRDALARALADDGIGTNVHYRVPVHLQPCYADLGSRRGDLPVSERRADELLSLPLDPMHADDEIRIVAARTRAILGRLREELYAATGAHAR